MKVGMPKRSPQLEPFDVAKNATEGMEEALYWHTVGVLADRGKSSGTAIAVTLKKQCFLLTARHVVDKTNDDDLAFFFALRER